MMVGEKEVEYLWVEKKQQRSGKEKQEEEKIFFRKLKGRRE